MTPFSLYPPSHSCTARKYIENSSATPLRSRVGVSIVGGFHQRGQGTPATPRGPATYTQRGSPVEMNRSRLPLLNTRKPAPHTHGNPTPGHAPGGTKQGSRGEKYRAGTRTTTNPPRGFLIDIVILCQWVVIGGCLDHIRATTPAPPSVLVILCRLS